MALPCILLLPVLACILITGPGGSRGGTFPNTCAEAMVIIAEPSLGFAARTVHSGHNGMGNSAQEAAPATDESLESGGFGGINSSGVAARQIQALQWNAHGECFVRCKDSMDVHCDKAYPTCRDGARQFLADTLRDSSSLDFVGLEQFNDESFFSAAHVDLGRWSNVTHTCGGALGYGVYPFDLATLIFDRQRWAPVGAARGGCFERVEGAAEPNYRAFLVQAFVRKGTEERMVVAVSHHPHTLQYKAEIAALKSAAAVVRAEAAAEKMLLIADTNAESPNVPIGRSSQSVMEDIYPGAGEVKSTDLLITCCAWQYVHTYDRIVAAHFPHSSAIATALPFLDVHPPFAARYMHDPVLATLTYPGRLHQNSDLKPAASGSHARAGTIALIVVLVLALSLILVVGCSWRALSLREVAAGDPECGGESG
mmetsp:Transcript_4461/g.12230  ORF Transcript_4461/g.12230 Transcript_4461/m.12230 type:complete len:426 (-) Transcript_4461:27-1304(-)